MHLWDILLPEAVITLNMFITSKINPKLSASTHIDGQYDYNRSPMAPPGKILIAHETTSRRRTWAPYCQDGWYIGLALEHYICYTVYVNITRGERVVETVECFPENFKLPFSSTQELATQAAKELTHASLHPHPARPFCQVGDEQALALKRLDAIFEGAMRSRKSKALTPPPHRAYYSFTSEGAKHNNTAEGGTANHIINIDAKFAPQTTYLSQKSGKPQTPHAMVRQSASQRYNLSQDMIAETVHQANHCFSFPARAREITIWTNNFNFFYSREDILCSGRV
jgi:hypothetical protein